MTSPHHHSTSSKPPLKRWKSRFLFVQKPMFWGASSVLILIGFMIFDYSRIQNNPISVDTDTTEQSEAITNQTRPQESLDSPEIADDPELREWAAAQENLPPNTINDNDEEIQLPAHSESGDLSVRGESDELLDSDTPLTDIANSSAANPGISEQDTNISNSISDSLSNTIVSNDDVLESLGLTITPPLPASSTTNSVTNSTVSPLTPFSTNSSGTSLTGTGNTPTPENTLPPSALAEALEALLPETGSSLEQPNSDSYLSNGTPQDERFPSTNSPTNDVPDGTETSTAANSSLPHTLLLPSSQGLTTQSPAVPQTAPLPGTTGYIAPAPLPSSPYSSALPGISPLQVPVSGTVPSAAFGIPGTSTAPSTLPQQPTVTLPQVQATPQLPSPVFPATVEPEHVPYTGGGRNGQINTFSNP
ncbi:MAG: hypothetical protein F6K09_02845 [Merismopedia sp. SIO2A8]|nr:hypothetical protein [Merismopedia sp. SIO2A8]